MVSWILITKGFHSISLSMFLRDWIFSISTSIPKVCKGIGEWKPPSEGVLKLNFDGASKGNLSPSGYGCVVRDISNNTICVMCEAPLGICNSIKPEVMALLMGLHELRELGISGCVWVYLVRAEPKNL